VSQKILEKNNKFYNIFIILFSLFAIAINLFSSINLKETLYYHDTKFDSDRMVLNLLNTVPKKVSILITPLEDKFNAEIASTSDLDRIEGIYLNVNDDKIFIKIGSNVIFDETIKSKVNKLKINYNLLGNKLQINLNNIEIKELKLEDKSINITAWNTFVQNNVNIKTEILTQPHSRIASKFKNYVNIIFLIFGIIFFKKLLTKKSKKIKLQINKFDFIAITTVSIIGFVAPPNFDDGEILSIVRNIREFGYAGSFDNAYPLGQIWFYLQRPIFENFNQIFLLRLPNLILFVATWFIIDKILLINEIDLRKLNQIRFFRLIIYVIFVLGWAGTLRYDAIIVLLLALIFYFYKKFLIEPNYQDFFIIMVLSIFGITTSLSGLTLVLFLLFFIIFNLKNLKNVLLNLSIIVYSCGFLTVNLFFNSNYWIFLKDIKFVLSGPDHNSGLNEIDRYKSIFELTGAPARLSVFVSLFLIIYSVNLIIIRKVNEIDKKFILINLITILGLIFTPSKVAWHFQVVLPTILIFAVYFLKFCKFKFKSNFIITCYFIFAFIISFKGINNFRYTLSETFRVNGPVNYYEKLLNISSFYSIFLLLLIVLSTWLLFIFFDFKMVIISICVLIICSPTIFYPVLDSFSTPNWHFFKQTTLGLFNKNWTCGITSTNKFLINDSYKFLDIQKNIIQINSKQFFEYDNRPSSNFWIANADTPTEGSVLLNYIDKNGEIIQEESLELNSQLFDNNWQIFTLHNSNAEKISIKFLPKDNTMITWRFIPPVQTKIITLKEFHDASNLSIGSYWANYLFFPCDNLGVKTQGRKFVPEYQFGNSISMRLEALYNVESENLSIGCLDMPNKSAQGLNCFYRVLVKGAENWSFRTELIQSKGMLKILSV